MSLTDTGYEGSTYAERRVRMVEALRASHDTLALVDFKADTAEGAILDQFCEELTDVDEAVAACWSALDPASTTSASALSVARLRGVSPRAASKSYVECDVEYTGAPAAPGALVAYVDGEPDNRWSNLDTVTDDGTYTFEAEIAGAAYTALADTLTQMVAVTGWTSITNPADSVTGRDEDTPEETLFRSEALRYAPGSNSLAAIRAAVLAVEGVIDAIVDNGSGSVHVLVWDGATADADDDAIAEAIWSKLTNGVATTGAVENLSTGYLVKFDRAAARPLYASIEISGAGVDFEAVKLAMQSTLPMVLGGTVRWAVMLTAVMQVPGVTDVDTLLLDDTDPPVQTGDNFTADSDEWLELDSGDIDVAYA